MKRYLITATFLLFSTLVMTNAYAVFCVVNPCQAVVSVVFQALGCAGISHGLDLVCDVKRDISSGQSVCYAYHWGDSDRNASLVLTLSPGNYQKLGRSLNASDGSQDVFNPQNCPSTTPPQTNNNW